MFKCCPIHTVAHNAPKSPTLSHQTHHNYKTGKTLNPSTTDVEYTCLASPPLSRRLRSRHETVHKTNRRSSLTRQASATVDHHYDSSTGVKVFIRVKDQSKIYFFQRLAFYCRACETAEFRCGGRLPHQAPRYRLSTYHLTAN